MSFNFKNIIQKGANTFAIQGLSIFLTLVVNWYLVSILGTEEYGYFTYAFSWVFFFGSLSTLGMEGVLMRKSILYKTSEKPGLIKGMLRYAKRINLVATSLILFVFIGFVAFIKPYFGDFEHPLIPISLILAILSLPIYSQLLLRQTTCISLKKIEYGLLPERIIRPFLFLVFLFIANQYLDKIELSQSIILNIIAFLFSFGMAVYFLKRVFQSSDHYSYDQKKEWVTLSKTFFLLYLIGSINARADILMLGFFGYTEKVGIYNIAVKIAQFVAMPLMLSNSIIAPYISQMFDNKKKELLSIIKRVIRMVFLIGLSGFLLFVFGGEFILSLFKPDFIEGYFVLVLIAGGQLFNIFVGPVGNILTMSKYENLALKGMAASALINITLNILLIPIYGMNGAAIATFTALVFWNILLFIAVYKKTGMNPSVL